MNAQAELNIVARLAELLFRVEDRAHPNFSGIGLIVTDNPSTLPILNLRPNSLPPHRAPADVILAEISTADSEYHDGFHVLSLNLEVSLIAQYFSPPIVAELHLDRSKRFGGRYLAALFGSTLPGVHVTGISSNGFGCAIFQNGVERLHTFGVSPDARKRGVLK